MHGKFLAVCQPKRSNAERLYESFVRAVSFVGVGGWKKLVGFGSDGTSINIAVDGMRGCLEESVPLVITFWCLAHCLELSLKDVLKDTPFNVIDEMLLRVYYCYEKSSKKCHECDEVVSRAN